MTETLPAGGIELKQGMDWGAIERRKCPFSEGWSRDDWDARVLFLANACNIQRVLSLTF